MKRMRFTAQELYVMAVAAGKQRMYGVPNGFEWVPEEEYQAVRQQVVDTLLDDDVLTMDFDGKLSLSSAYEELVNALCECGKCLTVNRQRADGSYEDLIFLQYGDLLLRAEVTETDYLFRETSNLEAEADLQQETWSAASGKGSQTVIPQLALTKAKRRLKENGEEEALRLLRQNGADDRIAAVLLDGLEEKAQYLRLLLMDMSSGTCSKTERAWLNSRGILLALSSAVVSFRTCTVFAEVDAADVAGELQELTGAFFKRQ